MSKKKDTKAEKEIIENDDIQPEVQEISIEDQLKKGDNLIFAAFGGGFTWGAIYLKWAYTKK